jgi:hypothetical protein
MDLPLVNIFQNFTPKLSPNSLNVWGFDHAGYKMCVIYVAGARHQVSPSSRIDTASDTAEWTAEHN